MALRFWIIPTCGAGYVGCMQSRVLLKVIRLLTVDKVILAGHGTMWYHWGRLIQCRTRMRIYIPSLLEFNRQASIFLL